MGAGGVAQRVSVRAERVAAPGPEPGHRRWREVEVTALVDGKSGVVSIEATAGVFVDVALPLQDGSAVFRYGCSRVEDARCAGRVVITARFAGLEATRSIQVVSPGGGAGGGSGVGGGTGDFAGGTAGGSPPFDCVGYDGGVHPGYTFEDGGALSLGCDGEPIDGVFLTTTSANRVSVLRHGAAVATRVDAGLPTQRLHRLALHLGQPRPQLLQHAEVSAQPERGAGTGSRSSRASFCSASARARTTSRTPISATTPARGPLRSRTPMQGRGWSSRACSMAAPRSFARSTSSWGPGKRPGDP
jgi:hypothetical protein